jgi:putative spermidine/putrescine transport system permease protein
VGRRLEPHQVVADAKGEAGGSFEARLSAFFWRRPRLKLGALLAPPLGAYTLVYVAALVVLLVSAFWTVDALTANVVHTWSFGNFQDIFSSPEYRRIAFRTILYAALVTVTDALIAFPLAYFMARVASRRTRALMLVLVLLPLWASYLARVYAWRLILAQDGALNWALNKVGLPATGISYTNTAVWIVFSYIWLPFMITPVFAALERVPVSFIEASGDLGAHGWTTFRRVVLPLALPGVVAGSIFTFSLTLGDYITPSLVGGASSSFIGNVIYSNVGVANNVPFAAAYATIPVLVMAVYLGLARRTGAFEAL